MSELTRQIGGGRTLRSRLTDLIELTRIRLSLMILFTAAVGYLMASAGHGDSRQLFFVLAGLGLVSMGATGLNQVIERESDRKMARTANRPLPAGRLAPGGVAFIGVLLFLIGVIVLYFGANRLTAILAAASGILYVGVYTPLKKRSSFNTLFGAVCGALPPLVGWVGATAKLSGGALALVAILFVWQLVHLLAIAWLYRDQYQRAGLVMVSVIDTAGGRLTMRLIVLFCLVLLPLSFLPALTGLTGYLSALAALVFGLAFLAVGIRLAVDRTSQKARGLFRASIVYLPVLLTTLLLDRLS